MFDKHKFDLRIPGANLFYQDDTDYLFIALHLCPKDPAKEPCCGISDCVSLHDLELYAEQRYQHKGGLTNEFMLEHLSKRIQRMKDDHKASCKKNHY